MTALLLGGGVGLGLAIAMAGAWLVQRRTRNAGWVDAIWSFALGLAGLTYALAPIPGHAWPAPRQIIVAAVIAIWSLRLGLHLAKRAYRATREDSRYARFRVEWGAHFERRMFWFLELQAAAAMLLAPAVLIAARNPSALGLMDMLAIVVATIALVGEALADRQLRDFKRDPSRRSGICDRGFWRWSRHPNYFFEWLSWLAYPLFAIDFSGTYFWGWLGFGAPALIYYLLVHVSGIPPLEQEMLRTRGAAYRDYQARTRAFFPWPKATET